MNIHNPNIYKVIHKINELTNEIELMGEALKFDPSLIDKMNGRLAARECLYQYLDNQ